MAMLVAFVVTASSVSARTMKVIASFGPPSNAASYQGYLTNAVALIKATGTLPDGPRTSPTDARLLTTITPEDLMTSTTPAFYRGSFSPVTPFENERGGTVFYWGVLTADPGETVALADMTFVISSSDSGNILGKTVSFNGSGVAYSATAPGIMLDGSMITSGSSTQQVNGRVIVGVASKSFTVNNADQVMGVVDFINQYSNWNLTVVMTSKGQVVSYPLFRIKPTLRGFISDGRYLVSAENNGDTMFYPLQSTLALGSNSVWSAAGSIRAGQTNDLGVVQGRATLFVRYSPSSPSITTQSYRQPPAVVDNPSTAS